MSAGIEKMIAEGRVDRQLALMREHWAAARRLWLDTPEPLRAVGLGDDLAPDVWWDTGLPGLAPITPSSAGLFEFAEGGSLALIVPVYDGLPSLVVTNAERQVEELRDLVAVDVDRPERFWRRRGDAVLLGNAFLEIAGDQGEPVPVFKTPLSWLRCGGAGVVVLDWDYARDLLLYHELIAEDIQLGERLEAALAPSIMVMEAV
jgi:hypothetical protein